MTAANKQPTSSFSAQRRKRDTTQATRRWMAQGLRNYCSSEPCSAGECKFWTLNMKFTEGTEFLTDSTAVNIVLFNERRNRFVGTPFRAAYNSTTRAIGAGFFASMLTTHTPGTLSLGVEVLKMNRDMTEYCAGWGKVVVGDNSNLHVTFQRGSAVALSKPSAHFSDDGQLPVKGVAEISSEAVTTHERSPLPEGVAFDLRSPPGATMANEKRVKLKIDNVKIAVPPAYAHTQTPHMLVVCVHNTYRALSQLVFVELNKSREEESALVGNQAIEFCGVPVHRDTAICAVLRRGDKAQAMAVHQPFADPTTTANCDVHVRCFPFLEGPFPAQHTHASIEAPAQSAFFSATNISLSYDAAIFDAERAKRAASRPVMRTDKREASQGAFGKEASLVKDRSRTSPRGSPGTPDLQVRHELQSLREEIKMLQDVILTQARRGEKGGRRPSQADSTESLLEEARALRQKREAEERAVSGEHPEELPEGVTQEEYQSALHLVEIKFQRVRLAHHLRGILASKALRITHPEGQHELQNGALLRDQSKTASQFIIRVEGMTLNRRLPPTLFMTLQYGINGAQRLGPMKLVPIVPPTGLEDAVTYHIQKDGEAHYGVIWNEPDNLASYNDPAVQAAYASFIRRHQLTGSIRFEVYDADSHFYVASGTVPCSKFARPPSIAEVCHPTDIDLHCDNSMRSGHDRAHQARVEFSPSDREVVGTLHVTLCSVAKAAPRAHPVVERASHIHKVLRSSPDNNRNGGNEGPVSSAIVNQPITGAVPTDFIGNDRRQLHLLRAQYVKKILHANPVATPAMFNAPITETDVNLRMQEKQDDELRCQKIAECLRARLTTTVHLYATFARVEVFEISFTNPYALSSTFTVQFSTDDITIGAFPADSPVVQSGDVVTVPARATIAIPFRYCSYVTHAGGASVTITLYTERREVVKIVDLRVTYGRPVVERRCEVIGSEGGAVVKNFTMRQLPQTAIFRPSDFTESIRSVCKEPYCSDTAVANVVAKVALNPLATGKYNGWEYLEVSVGSFPSNATSVFVAFYNDASLTSVWEVWELSLIPVVELQLPPILVGQSNYFKVPVQLGRNTIFCENRRVTLNMPLSLDRLRNTESETAPEAILRYHPTYPGRHQFSLHVVDEAREVVGRYFCTMQSTMPERTMETRTMEIAAVNAGVTVPLLKNFKFTNNSLDSETFTVHHNWKHLVAVAPREPFSLLPNDSRQIIMHMKPLAVGRYDIYLWFNNAEDKTVEVMMLDISVVPVASSDSSTTTTATTTQSK